MTIRQFPVPADLAHIFSPRTSRYAFKAARERWGQRQESIEATSATRKEVWVETTNQQTFTSALEAGATTFLFQEDQGQLVEAWQKIANFDAVLNCKGDLERDKRKVGAILRISSKEDLTNAEALCEYQGTIVMDSTDWRIIPAENLVAAFQGKAAAIFGVCSTAQDAQILLEALEIGADGVVLRSNDFAEVSSALEYVKEMERLSAERLTLVPAKVVRVQQLGMGDRAAVDLCSLLVPGEGLLVGSFCRGLFLVHSECCESHYINSRPFRINCGPVHSYCTVPGGKTAYLSELKSGSEVVVVKADGRQRSALVGRVKIETRPLVLVEVELEGDKISIVLQNAETVRLVSKLEDGKPSSASVTELNTGDEVLVHRQEGARHTGIAVRASLIER